jgi:hypothetical protein
LGVENVAHKSLAADQSKIIVPQCRLDLVPFDLGASQFLARPERFELPTTAFEAQYSIQLSYGRAGLAVCQRTDSVANPLKTNALGLGRVRNKVESIGRLAQAKPAALGSLGGVSTSIEANITVPLEATLSKPAFRPVRQIPPPTPRINCAPSSLIISNVRLSSGRMIRKSPILFSRVWSVPFRPRRLGGGGDDRLRLMVGSMQTQDSQSVND